MTNVGTRHNDNVGTKHNDNVGIKHNDNVGTKHNDNVGTKHKRPSPFITTLISRHWVLSLTIKISII
jgi:hypothetical protein